MKKTFKNNHIMLWFTVLLCAVTIVSCSKWDDFTKYTEDGEILYTGKLDSVKIYSGKKRVRFTGLLKADPKIAKIKISWNNSADSVVYDIVKGVGLEVFDRTFSVDEGIKTFKVFTYDALGNPSVPVTISARVYGDSYQSSIINRGIEKAEVQANGSALISWADVNAAAGIINMRIKYSDKLSIMHDTLIKSALTGSIPGTLFTTSLPNFKLGSAISYNTAYRPTSTAIDTFYVAYQTQNVKYEVTSLYLSNVGPFTKATLSGRWGTLAAPWVTNAAAKNKGGINGGYTADAGGAINWETYNNDPVINGIVYQPTSLPLPAGKYIVSFDEFSEIQTNSSVYCVVAAGGNGIPILANLSTALGYGALYNGAVIGTNAPNVTDTRSFEFTLATSQVVSIGFLGNLASTPRGNYFRVSAIRLYKY